MLHGSHLYHHKFLFSCYYNNLKQPVVFNKLHAFYTKMISMIPIFTVKPVCTARKTSVLKKFIIDHTFCWRHLNIYQIYVDQMPVC